MELKSYITDLHVNLHPDQIDLLDKWYQHSKKVMDFFTLAYYPYHMVKVTDSFNAEEEIDSNLMNEQWEKITDYLLKKNQSDHFISFLGYEWQGTGEDGDHNIYFKDNRGPILLKPRYQNLVEAFKGKQVVGLPHHLGYLLGNRGKNWDTNNELFSPLVEIYSHHGSSESDETNLPMDRHSHMGPRVDGGTVVDGLTKGSHFGIIASGDNHEVPGFVKHGRAGVWAEHYTKDSIWDAMLKRRTFGFTDSIIRVWMESAGAAMGSVISSENSTEEIQVNVEANSAIERFELYKNGRINQIKIAKPAQSSNDSLVTFKFKIDMGWGPDTKSFPDLLDREWKGALTTSGKILSVEQVYSSFDNDYDFVDDSTVHFSAITHQPSSEDGWMRDNSLKNEGFIFEVQADKDSEIEITINGKTDKYTVSEILNKSHLIIFEDEAKSLMKERTGIVEYYRSDSWYHNAYKVKLSKGSLEGEYKQNTNFTVSVPGQETSYYVKVVQVDGQTAWSSPIWISAK